MKKDVFISYRNNDGTKQLAGRMSDALKKEGYSVFYDDESLHSGDYEEQLFQNIDECTDFVLVLPPQALDRRDQNTDWLYKELNRALIHKKNVIPFMLKGFEMPNEEALPLEIREVANKHGIDASSKTLFNETIKKLSRDFLHSHKRRRQRHMLWSIAAILMLVFMFLLLCFIGNRVANLTTTISNPSGPIWTGEIAENYSKGKGTKQFPYQISSAEQLARLSFLAHYDNTHMAGQYFELTNDIYLNEIKDFNNHSINIDSPDEDPRNKYNIWTPIGNQSNPFDGFFDGRGHTIYGLYIDDKDLNYLGLFGCCTSDSVISNVTIDTTYIHGNSYVGALTGSSAGRLDNCTARNVTLIGKKYVGGLTGYGYFIVNSGVFKICLNSDYDYASVYENTFLLEQYLENECFGGIAGVCSYIVNSESAYVYIEKPGYKSGALVGELLETVYNTVSDHAVIGLYFPYHLYAKELHNAGLEFCYSDNIGYCTNPYADINMETYVDLEFEGFSYQPNLHGWAYTEEDRMLIREAFETYYPDIQIIEEADINTINDNLYRYSLNNHDILYRNNKAVYNSLTKTGSVFSSNMNLHMETLPKNDDNLFHLLENYVTDGGVFRKWIALDETNLPGAVYLYDLIHEEDELDSHWFF